MMAAWSGSAFVWRYRFASLRILSPTTREAADRLLAWPRRVTVQFMEVAVQLFYCFLGGGQRVWRPARVLPHLAGQR
jgi:hypothetical protein